MPYRSASPQVRPTAVRSPADPTQGLVLATLLAGLAGMVDAIGYLRLGHLFVSYMSGNSTLFAIAVGQGDLAEAFWILTLIALFVRRGGRPAARRLWRAAPPDLGAGRGNGSAARRGVCRRRADPDGARDGRSQRLAAPRRQYRCQPDLCDRHAGQVRPGPGQFRSAPDAWMGLAGAGSTLGRIGCRRHRRRVRLSADRRRNRLGAGHHGEPPGAGLGHVAERPRRSPPLLGAWCRPPIPDATAGRPDSVRSAPAGFAAIRSTHRDPA